MALNENTIHVGRAALEQTGEVLRSLESHLSDDERARAARFRFDRDRTRFVCARGMLRRLLGAELDLPPHRIRFDYGAHGKPSLAAEQATSGVCFNLSHSEGLGLFVLARNRSVGADLEQVRSVRDGLAGDDWSRAFSVAVSEHDTARILRVDGDSEACERFWLTAIPVEAGFEAAAVVEGGPCSLAPLSIDSLIAEAPR